MVHDLTISTAACSWWLAAMVSSVSSQAPGKLWWGIRPNDHTGIVTVALRATWSHYFPQTNKPRQRGQCMTKQYQGRMKWKEIPLMGCNMTNWQCLHKWQKYGCTLQQCFCYRFLYTMYMHIYRHQQFTYMYIYIYTFCNKSKLLENYYYMYCYCCKYICTFCDREKQLNNIVLEV